MNEEAGREYTAQTLQRVRRIVDALGVVSDGLMSGFQSHLKDPTPMFVSGESIERPPGQPN
ncbi:hypothetical protein HSB1_42350 [Halogranum salarium B-1]|uniref:Uncharacterized protein n=1 Tax=Halogranum salarium B-1 TaxID=1210908 RepID=J3ETN2_9EURY|nr:hypothetical protein HSB1_42350 [Halogranum salarium B-1]